MITIYKKQFIPQNVELITNNDYYFNKFTSELIDERAALYMKQIDGVNYINKYNIMCKFDQFKINDDKLSTGCKTVLNIIYNPDKIFDIYECGDNVLDVIYALPLGNVCCDYPLISYNMKSVQIKEKDKTIIIDSYDDLKAWWKNEN